MKPNFSSRLKNCNPSATLEISEMASKLERKGKDVISLGVGEPDFDTPEPIKQCAIQALKDGFVHYTESQGIENLREKITQKLKKQNGVDTNKKEIITTPGAKYALYLICQGLIDEGEEAMLFDPAWVSYPEMIKLAGGKVKWCPTDENHSPEVERFKEIIHEGTKLVILNSPCNPTGKVYSKETIEAITEISREKDVFVISDEVYEKIIYEKSHYSPRSDYENVITVNGFSKTYSMTGWRLGYLNANEEIVNNLTKIQQHSVSCPTSFVQKGARCALTDEIDPYVDEMVNKFEKRRDLVMEKLNKIEQLSCNEPEGSFYAFPKVGVDSMKFSKKMLKKANVAITPGKAFGRKGEGHFRMSFANSEERINEALNRISVFLEEVLNSFS
ncbi:aspartate aminotransferase [archaeon SCG-AAA382B04]|nr:aspartate aminotransferase [archaeon SCG-AAA382B04]